MTPDCFGGWDASLGGDRSAVAGLRKGIPRPEPIGLWDPALTTIEETPIVYTLQEAFDHIVKAVVKQGRPSVTAAGTCMYRGPEGLKCAAGHLLEDEDVRYYEGVGVMNLPATTWLKYFRPNDVEAGRDMLLRLQSGHDNARDTDFVDDFLGEARAVANRFNLTMPELP